MQEAVSRTVPVESRWLLRITSRARIEAPTLTEWAAGLISALLLILAFPDFDLFFLSWVALVPLLLVVARRPSAGRALVLGWATGAVFFYGSCYWLTYSMIHYGGLSPWLAYLLLVPGALVVGLFPGLFALILALAIKRWGQTTVLVAPFIWPSMEWARLAVTGQLWNAIGYSQAHKNMLADFVIQSASWGGVYAVGFLILTVNAAIAYAILKRRPWAIVASGSTILFVAAVIFTPGLLAADAASGAPFYSHVVALQPNVPMSAVKSPVETKELLERHLSMSTSALKLLPNDNVPRLVVWPESPMNFAYGSDQTFKEVVAKFTKENHISLLFNSLESAPGDGFYNSALLINEEGRLIAQYDKIRLMPFGEYVPLPHWLPGASLITAIVGDFTPGERYTLMPVGDHRVGVFICIESAYPWIARTLTKEGADVLINISNDGYLGPTAVMRQHLGNAIFRAVENGRPVLRVTNSGISAYIRADGFVAAQTDGFQPDVRIWSVSRSLTRNTFYTRYGDVVAYICTAITALVFIGTLFGRRSISDFR